MKAGDQLRLIAVTIYFHFFLFLFKSDLFNCFSEFS